jgi:hypothetical protein
VGNSIRGTGAKDPNYRGLDYWIELVKAEREAQNAA